jgi:hypothetical protein
MYSPTTDAEAMAESTAQLTMPQSCGREARTEHRHPADKRLAQQVVQMDRSGTHWNLMSVREAYATRRASKRKKCPTELENNRNRARIGELSGDANGTHVPRGFTMHTHHTILANHYGFTSTTAACQSWSTSRKGHDGPAVS